MSKHLPISTPELIDEFEWTRCRHGGLLSVAAHIFGINPEALARRFQRAKAQGIHVDYHDDTKKLRS
jgi:hypothetical protein